MSLDERATLTNMAVEAGGFTGIIEADDVVVEHIHSLRGTDKDQLRAQIVKADDGASYAKTFDIDLATCTCRRWLRPATRATASTLASFQQGQR